MDYLTLVNEARKKTLRLTIAQSKELVDIYRGAMHELAGRARAAKDKSITERWAKDYLAQVKKAQDELQERLGKSIKESIAEAAKNAVAPELALFKELQAKAGIDLGAHFTDMFSKVPDEVLAIMIRGEIYKDGKGLSDRIWLISEGLGQDIEYMIKRGIAAQKSAYELAKDLEFYVRDSAKRPWSWGTVYPNLRTKEIDYNAQRLARTSITHAHRESQYRAAARNPFVEAIHWELSLEHFTRQVARWGHDECDEYAEQNWYGLGEGNFPVDKVPLSHPQCLCVTYPVIPEDFDEIAERIEAWADGGKDKELERWFKEHGDYFAGVDIGQQKLLKLHDKVLKADKALQKFDTDKKYSGIWKNDVTLKDYASKKHAIGAKNEYFDSKILGATTKAEEEKFLKLKELLEQYRIKGEAYLSKQRELAQLENQLRALFINEADVYSSQRKDLAYWFKNVQEADDVLRGPTGKIWNSLSKEEKQALWRYTSGSGPFNRPLRGYDRSWYNFKGIGKVPLNNEGQEHGIRNAASAISKSKYDFDIWLQRGIETDSGLSKFLQISVDEIRNCSQAELEEKLLGKVVKDEAFLSTSGAKGRGFSGHIINLYAPEGTEMIYAEPFSEYGRGAQSPNWDGVSKQSSFGYEFEVILNKGYNYRVTKVEKAPDGRLYVDVDVLRRD